MVDQIDDLFLTTHKVKTQQVIKSRGQHCGDIELSGYHSSPLGFSLSSHRHSYIGLVFSSRFID